MCNGAEELAEAELCEYYCRSICRIESNNYDLNFVTEKQFRMRTSCYTARCCSIRDLHNPVINPATLRVGCRYWTVLIVYMYTALSTLAIYFSILTVYININCYIFSISVIYKRPIFECFEDCMQRGPGKYVLIIMK